MKNWITVRYEGGEARVTLAANTEYGSRGNSVTATLEVPDSDPAVGELEELLEDLLERHTAEMTARLEYQKAKSLVAEIETPGE